MQDFSIVGDFYWAVSILLTRNVSEFSKKRLGMEKEPISGARFQINLAIARAHH